MNKAIIYLLYFTFFTLVLLFFGKSGFKKTKDIRGFFVAGNSLGLLASILTFTATWFSAASMQGLSGSIFAYGYSSILYSVVAWFLGAGLLVLMSVKLKDYDILTVPEYFKIRYNSRILQALGGLIIILTYVFYIIIQIRGFGIVMSELLDIHYTVSIFLVYLFIIYTTFGGLYSVSKTDGLNFSMIFLGILLAVIIILKDIGGITVLHQKASLISSRPFSDFPNKTLKGALVDPFSKGMISPIVLFTSFFGWGLGLAANPQYAIRVVSAKNKKTAVKMICISVLILALIYIGIFIIGLGARVLKPSIESVNSVDEVFAYIINNVIYSKISGFILIGIAAAAISTANSQLLILASGFTYDIYKNLFNPNIKENSLLNLNRFFIFIAGTISLFLSIRPPKSLLIFGGNIWGVFTATFLLPLYGGLYWKKATKEGAIASIIGGLVTMFLVFDKNNLMGIGGNNSIHPAFLSFVVALILFIIVSYYTYRKGDEL